MNQRSEIRDDENVECYSFPMDLVSLAKKHVEFLRDLHVLGISISKPSLESLRRYRDLWLPMVFKSHPKKKLQLIPPPDIAWLWHCHRLAPYRYESYLKSCFGRDCPILEASPPFVFQSASDNVLNKHHCGNHEVALQSQEVWRNFYPEEEFFLSFSMMQEKTNADFTASLSKSDVTLFLGGFDLLGSAGRQATFLWQVSGPCFLDDGFLLAGLGNYCRFLRLIKFAKQQIIVPTYQIDLFWHTHILISLKQYYRDCQTIIGSTLNHDDSFNDRTEGGALDIAFTKTKELWQEQYGEEYFVPGGMYRGEPPAAYYTRDWISRRDYDMSPLGPYLHWVGIQGASSTNPNDEVGGTGRWTNPRGVAPDCSPGFIAPSPRSTTRGMNANPKRTDYIFGRPSPHDELGYYHVTTREAYLILVERIKAKVRSAQSDLECTVCMNSFFSCGMAGKTPTIVQKEANLEELQRTREIILARSKAERPVGVMGIPSTLLHDQRIVREYYSDTGLWIFPPTCYDAGGGCGACGVGGGGCGGGAAESGCGAGACGGGGGG